MHRGVRYLDDGCDELLQERVFEQRRPVVVEEVDEEPFDVGAVLILQRHTHTHTRVGQLDSQMGVCSLRSQ